MTIPGRLLQHSIVIDHEVDGPPDRYGHADSVWVEGDPIPAFVDDLRGREINGPVLGGQTITDVMIFTNPLTIIPGEQDRIRDVTDGHGDILYEIRHVRPAYRGIGGTLHHLEIFADALGAGEQIDTTTTEPEPEPEPEPPVPGAAYGSAVSGDSRANQRIGGVLNGRLDYRFIASATSAANTLRVQQRGGVGYSLGDGGTISGTIQTDDGGLPSGTVLATVTWLPGNPGGNWEVWTLLTFPSPATLTAGETYHLVFENTAADPVNNYISLNMLFQFGTLPTPRQAAYPDTFATLYAEPTTWVPQDQFLPIFDLAYASGDHDGQGYVGTLWEYLGSIDGTLNQVRERFTVLGGDITVTAAHIRLKRISGTGDLVVTLETGTGTLIEAVNIPATDIDIGILPDGSAPSLAGDTWAVATFLALHTLTEGAVYNLVLSTDASTQYTAVPLREGGSFGLLSRVFGDGYAQRTTDGGTSWEALYEFDETDLQFYFETSV